MSPILLPHHYFAQFTACSYEGYLFGWSMKENQSIEEIETTQLYGFNCNAGQLKCLSNSHSGKYLVTGGDDERIHIFNMNERKSLGELSQHTGAITTLSFYQDSHLLSGAEDGNICIWRVYDWQCLHILGGHKGAVIDLSVHPSGKLALSISRDGTLKLWNLVQGRCSFTKRLKQVADQILWHEEGECYLVVSQRTVQLFAANDNNVVRATLVHNSRVNKAVFVSSLSHDDKMSSNWRIVTACDNQELNIFDFEGTKLVSVDLSSLGLGRPRSLVAVAGNMKAVNNQTLRQSLVSFGDGNEHEDFDHDTHSCVAIATSTGFIALFSLSGLELVGRLDQKSTNNEDLSLEAAVLSMHHVKGDPRFTALANISSKAIDHKVQPLHDESADRSAPEANVEEENTSNSSSSGKKRKVQFDSSQNDLRMGKAIEHTKEKLSKSAKNSLFGKPKVTIIEEEDAVIEGKASSKMNSKGGKKNKRT